MVCKICTLFGLALSFTGTAISLWTVISASSATIKGKSTHGYMNGGPSMDASAQKFQGKIGILILLDGTLYQSMALLVPNLDWLGVTVFSSVVIILSVINLLKFRRTYKQEKTEFCKQ